MNVLGERMAELRKDKGLKQTEVAETLDVTKGTISNYETGVHCPSYETLIKIAKLYSVSTDYLLGLDNRIPQRADEDEKVLLDLTAAQIQAMISALSARHKQSLYDMLTSLYTTDAP